MCLERAAHSLPKQTRVSCKRRRINLACVGISQVLYLTFEGISFLSDFVLLNRRVNTLNWFCSVITWEILQRHWCSHCLCRQPLQTALCQSLSYTCVRAPANVCVIELSSANQPKPVISHVNAGLKAKRKISWGTYNNNTWKMEQSLFLQSSQARRGCLSLWEDVWLPPLYVCFGPLSWFCYTSTFSSKHVKIFHAH